MTTALLSRRVGPVPLQRLLRVGLAGLPVIFAVPILVALVQGIANIVAQGHPFFGDISGTATDSGGTTPGVASSFSINRRFMRRTAVQAPTRLFISIEGRCEVIAAWTARVSLGA